MSNQLASSFSKKSYWFSGVVMLVLLIVVVGVYQVFYLWVGPAPDKSKYDLSFVTVPSKPVPDWLNHGNGMIVSITIKAWDPEYYNKFQRDGICIIPTSINTTQTLSLYFVPPTPLGFSATNGGGPSSFENAVNRYLQQHHLAQLQQGQMNQIGSINGTFRNVSFSAGIGNSGFPKLGTSDVRLAILDVRERGNQFKVMWSKVYLPTNLWK